MKEVIFEFVNQYAVWGILIVVCLAVFMMWRMHRQLKRLNRSLGTMTGKIQEYLKAVMEEEPKEDQMTEPERVWREEPFITKEEREFLAAGKREHSPEDEAVIHAVLQEYFS